MLITISKLEEGDRLQVNICPRQLKDGENQALTTPLSACGSAAELDNELVAQVASFVAAQVGLGMENAELARQTATKLQETETLLSVSQALASTLDVEALARQLLRHVVRGLGADLAGMWLVEDDGQSMAPLAGYHVPAEHLAQMRGIRIPLVGGHPFHEDALRRRQAVVTTDGRNDPRLPEHIRRALVERVARFPSQNGRAFELGRSWVSQARTVPAPGGHPNLAKLAVAKGDLHGMEPDPLGRPLTDRSRAV